MTMLREEAPSVLAVLDAFVHDPLMDWFVKVRHTRATVCFLTLLARGLHYNSCSCRSARGTRRRRQLARQLERHRLRTRYEVLV